MRLLVLAALTGLAFYFLLNARPAGQPPATAPPIDQSGPLPAGKPAAHFRDARLKDAFIAFLKGKGIAYRVVFANSREYVVWEGPDNLTYEFMSGGTAPGK